jgi:hypothetical protein
MKAWELDQRTPPEHRFLGLDRRYIAPLLLVVVVWLLWAVIAPAANEAISRDEIPAGTTAELPNDVTFSPAAGWVYAAPPFPGVQSLELFNGGTTFTIRSGEFDGTSTELLKRVRDADDDTVTFEGPVRFVPLAGGVRGAAQSTHGADSEGAYFAFAHDGVGVTVVIDGPTGAVDVPTEDIAAMIASIRFGAPEAGS